MPISVTSIQPSRPCRSPKNLGSSAAQCLHRLGLVQRQMVLRLPRRQSPCLARWCTANYYFQGRQNLDFRRVNYRRQKRFARRQNHDHAQGQLMLSGAGALHPPAEFKHQSLAWFSSDGRDWSTPVNIGDPNFWLWRTTWHKKTAYSIGYDTTAEKSIRLYTSKDGRQIRHAGSESF